jgi:hypothetical protein
MTSNFAALAGRPPLHRQDGAHWLHVPSNPARPLSIEHTLLCSHNLHSPGNGAPAYITGYTCGVGVVEADGGVEHFFRHVDDVDAAMGTTPLKPGRYPITATFYAPEAGDASNHWHGQLQVTA